MANKQDVWWCCVLLIIGIIIGALIVSETCRPDVCVSDEELITPTTDENIIVDVCETEGYRIKKTTIYTDLLFLPHYDYPMFVVTDEEGNDWWDAELINDRKHGVYFVVRGLRSNECYTLLELGDGGLIPHGKFCLPCMPPTIEDLLLDRPLRGVARDFTLPYVLPITLSTTTTTTTTIPIPRPTEIGKQYLTEGIVAEGNDSVIIDICKIALLEDTQVKGGCGLCDGKLDCPMCGFDVCIKPPECISCIQFIGFDEVVITRGRYTTSISKLGCVAGCAYSFRDDCMEGKGIDKDCMDCLEMDKTDCIDRYSLCLLYDCKIDNTKTPTPQFTLMIKSEWINTPIDTPYYPEHNTTTTTITWENRKPKNSIQHVAATTTTTQPSGGGGGAPYWCPC